MNKRSIVFIACVSIFAGFYYRFVFSPKISAASSSVRLEVILTPTPRVRPTSTPSPTVSPLPTATPSLVPTETPVITPTPGAALPIPLQSDWTPATLAFTHGALGEWDYYLWGGFANSLIKKDGVYYLYYQGSNGYSEVCGDNTYRYIGVATSTDGINWTKSPNNPVIAWASRGTVTEGAVSSGAWLGVDGKIYLYYGANTAQNSCLIHASGRVSVSSDGIHFTDSGEVLPWYSATTWGYGDEIFPLGVYVYQNSWNVFYTPNGTPQTRKLGVAIGNSFTSFPTSLSVNDGTVEAWGPVSAVLNGSTSILVTNPNTIDRPLNFYRFEAANPATITFDTSYSLSDCFQASVIYEPEQGRYMMSCRDPLGSEYYSIKYAYVSQSSANSSLWETIVNGFKELVNSN